MKPNRIIIGSHRLKSNIPRLAIGLGSLNFSRLITGRYGIFLRSDSLPALIFRRLSGMKNVSNSLNSVSLNNYRNLQNFSNSINQFKINLRFFNIGKIDFTKIFCKPLSYARSILTSVNPMMLSNLQRELNFDTSRSINAAIQNMGTLSFKKTETDSKYKDNLTKQIGKRKKQIVKIFNQYPLYLRNIQAVVNPLTLSYSPKTFNFEFSSLKHDQIATRTKKKDEALKNIILATQEMDTPYFSKKDNNSHYENNLIKQIGERRKQFITTLNQYPFYTQNILAAVNSMTLSNLQRKHNFVTLMSIKAAVQDMGTLSFKETEKDPQYKKSIDISVNPTTPGFLDKTFNFELSSLKHDQMVVSSKSIDKTSKNTSLSTQEMDILSLSKKDNDSHQENYLIKQIGERKKQFIKTFNQYPFYARNILAMVNLTTFSHLQRELKFVTSTSIKTSIQDMGTLSFKKTEISTKYENNLTKQIEKIKKQLAKVFDQYPLYAQNILAVVNPVTLSYLEKTFNFEFTSLKHYQIGVITKKIDGTLKNASLASKETDTPYFRKEDNNSHYKNNLIKQIGEKRKQFITTLNRYPFYARILLAVVNSMMLSHLQKELNFVTPMSLKAAIQDMDILSFKKIENNTKYENNLTKQIGVRKNQLITALNQYTPNQYTPNQYTPNQYTPNQYTPNQYSLNQYTPNQYTPNQYTPNQYTLNQYTLFARNILAVANSVTLSHFHNSSDFKFPNLGHGQVPGSINKSNNVSISINAAKKIGIHPIRESVNSKSADTLTLQQVGILKKTDQSNPYLSAKAILTSGNHMTLSYLQRAFNFKTVNSSLVRIFSSTKNIDKTSNIVFATRQGIDSSSSQQTINIRDLQYGHLFKRDTNLTGRDEVPAFRNRRFPGRSINQSYDNVFPNPPINFEYLSRSIKNNKLPEVDNDIGYESRELVLKKPSPQKAEVFSENKGEAQTENISSSKIHYDSGKELTREKPIHEIDMIADRVYKLIERRISIEKDRRGLF